jgi:RHS repeat-associated protein
MKRTRRIVTAWLVLLVGALCSSSVLGDDGSGNTSGGTSQREFTTCQNSTHQPCGDCTMCANGDKSDSNARDCAAGERPQVCKCNSPTGVIESRAESFTLIDDDGPAAAPAGGGCPSCATTGAGIPEDSQLMRLRLSRIWRSTWETFGSFGWTMYTGYDYWVSVSIVDGGNFLVFHDPNNSMEADFIDSGDGFISLGGDDHLTQVVEATATHVIFRKLDGRLFRFDWTDYFQNGALRRARLNYIEDRNGNRINFNYVTPVTNSTPDVMMWKDAVDPYGRTFQFSYRDWQSNNVLSQVTLPDGRAITYSYDETINSFFTHKVDYGNGIESTWSYDDVTKLNQRNEALLPADHYQQSILLSHFAHGRTRWIKRADGTFVYSRTSSEDAGVFTSLIYHLGETSEVKSSPTKVLLSHRQQRVDGTWEDLTTYEADDRRPVKSQTQPDGRTWNVVRDPANDRISVKTYPDGSTESFTYNEFAQPTSHTHRSGAIELWNYDAKGNLLSHTEAAGATNVEATESWSYNARGQVVSHTDFNGNQTTYEYYTNGDLRSLTLPQSTGQPAGTITYTYDAAGRLANVTDPVGRPLSYTYDAAGRLIITTFGDGSTEQMNYDSGEFSARLLSKKDRNGNHTEYTFDATGRVLTAQVREAATNNVLTITTNTWDGPTGRLMAVDRDGDSTEYTYDYKGRILTTTVHPNADKVLTTTNVYDQYHLLSTIDAYGRKTSYTYDALDRVLSTAVELTPGGATITTKNEYDAEGRQTGYIDGKGIPYAYEYDDRDRKTRELSAVGTPVEAVETYSYDGNNNQLSLTDKNGNPWTRTYTARNALRTDANPLNEQTTYSYYADGLRESETNPNRHTTTFLYDTCCGRLIEVVDANQNSIRYEYDANGNRTKVTDQSGRVTVYAYDGLNRQTEMIADPAGLNLRTVTAYDPTFDVIGRKETMTSPAAQVVTTEYEGLGRTARVSGDTPKLIYTYDQIEDGLLKHITTDANNNTRSTLTDGAGRTIKIIDGLDHATVMTYDKNGNLLTALDRDGRLNRSTYDKRNRRLSITEDDGGIDATTQFQYDAVGNLRRITDATGKVTRYSYDPTNRRLTATYAFNTSEARTWNYRYFPLGQLKRLTKPNGIIINYTYDNLERLKTRKYLAGTANRGTDTFTYHANGLLKKAVSGLYATTVDRSKLAADYDGANRLLREREDIGAGAKTVAYVYDPDSRLKQITYPGGTRMQQTYTNRRELFEVRINDQMQARDTYDAAGRRVLRAYGNGRATQWEYDAEDRITRLNHSVQGWDYRYTNEGDAVVQNDLTTPVQGEAYTYDGMHRLVDNKHGQVVGDTVPFPTSSQGWTLDKVGNWTVWNDNGANETRTHNNHHALTSRSAIPFPQAYDANFNQTDDGSAFTFVYDANDQLQQVKNRTTGVVLARYRYDAFGRRVEKLIPTAPLSAGVTRYYYSDQRIIEERNVNDAVQATYTYDTYIDEPLTMDRGGNRFYYHSNKQFSTYALTNSTGQIVERYSYTPYGQVTTFDAAYQNPGFISRVGNPFTFTGRELDAETGLMHFRARTYDTVQGRFKQPDAAEYIDGMNLYAAFFVPNQIDPTGKSAAVVGSVQASYNVCNGDFSIDGWIWAGIGFEKWGIWWGTSGFAEGNLYKTNWGALLSCGKCKACCSSSSGQAFGAALVAFNERLSFLRNQLSCGILINPTGKCSANVEGICLLNLIDKLGRIGRLAAKAGRLIGAQTQLGIQVNVNIHICLDGNDRLTSDSASIGGGGYIEFGWSPSHKPGKPPYR